MEIGCQSFANISIGPKGRPPLMLCRTLPFSGVAEKKREERHSVECWIVFPCDRLKHKLIGEKRIFAVNCHVKQKKVYGYVIWPIAPAHSLSEKSARHIFKAFGESGPNDVIKFYQTSFVLAPRKVLGKTPWLPDISDVNHLRYPVSDLMSAAQQGIVLNSVLGLFVCLMCCRSALF